MILSASSRHGIQQMIATRRLKFMTLWRIGWRTDMGWTHKILSVRLSLTAITSHLIMRRMPL